MRAHCSLFVDAGYLLAAGSTRVAGTSLRSATDVDLTALLMGLVAQVEQASGLPLLRALWYDGTRQATPTPEQRSVGLLPKAKLRLGRIGVSGEQKGVDVKLALDLITLARNQATEVAFLVSGDDDLSEAVEEAQQHGVQVHVLAVPDADGQPIAVSHNLLLTVDDALLIDAALLDCSIRRSASSAMRSIAQAARPEATVEPDRQSERVPAPPGPARPSPLTVARLAPVAVPERAAPVYSTSTPGGSSALPPELDEEHEDAIADVVSKVVDSWWRTATPDIQAALTTNRPSIPAELDRVLLSDLSTRLGIYDLPQQARFRLRAAFWEKVETLP